MAKKKTTHPIHMHVPSKFGFTILAIAVMVYGLFLASAYNSSTQTVSVQSHAAALPTPLKKATPTPLKRPTPTPLKRPTPTPIKRCQKVCLSGNRFSICTAYKTVCK